MTILAAVFASKKDPKRLKLPPYQTRKPYVRNP
jgi:hypothetical protein